MTVVSSTNHMVTSKVLFRNVQEAKLVYSQAFKSTHSNLPRKITELIAEKAPHKSLLGKRLFDAIQVNFVNEDDEEVEVPKVVLRLQDDMIMMVMLQGERCMTTSWANIMKSLTELLTGVLAKWQFLLSTNQLFFVLVHITVNFSSMRLCPNVFRTAEAVFFSFRILLSYLISDDGSRFALYRAKLVNILWRI